MINSILKFLSFLIAILLIFLTFNANAATFICPNTYQTVTLGYTTDQVQSACGTPTNTTTQSGVANLPVTYEQWIYTATSSGPQILPDKQEAQLIILFNNNGTVESLTTQNAAVMTGIPCHDFNQLQIGATKDAVQLQCGPPSSINTIQRASNQPQNLTIWTYNYGPYRPQIIFAFQNDKLTDVRMGQLGK